jgi:rhamnopyranosyl-N-acetylglucosaminyl-diphospho-decaprenol beta-1,3/1,4-galactofuranosyltransferase
MVRRQDLMEEPVTRISIAAVFATMNRAPTAVACVKSLAMQTRPPELVVVADNVSTDDTKAQLESLIDLPFRLIVLHQRENRGNAGGVEDAMELAFGEGVDAVWILDDDSWPRVDALEAMLAKPWNPQVVRHAMQVDPKTGKFTWPLQVADTDGSWKLVSTFDDMPEGDFLRSRIIWTGALVPRHVREVAGPVNGALFIRGEDEEYPWRIEQAGFQQEAVRHAVMDHPGPDDMVHLRLFGKNFFFERGLSEWKLYYKVRNMVWLKRRQTGSLHAFAMAIAYGLVSGWFDGLKRIGVVWEAAVDGWNGHLGKWKRH